MGRRGATGGRRVRRPRRRGRVVPAAIRPDHARRTVGRRVEVACGVSTPPQDVPAALTLPRGAVPLEPAPPERRPSGLRVRAEGQLHGPGEPETAIEPDAAVARPLVRLPT